jgi:tight adherence protein B
VPVSALPAVLDDIARSLRSGASVSQAIIAAAARPGPGSRQLAGAVEVIERGATTADALARWLHDWPDPGVRLAVAALTLSLTSGGGPARAVEQVAATVRERLALDAEVRALAAPARTSAIVLLVAPLAFMLLAVTVDRRVGAFLFATPGGWMCLALAAGLDLGGAAWSRRLVGAVS